MGFDGCVVRPQDTEILCLSLYEIFVLKTAFGHGGQRSRPRTAPKKRSVPYLLRDMAICSTLQSEYFAPCHAMKFRF